MNESVITSSDYAMQLRDALTVTRVTGASFAYWDGTTLHAATAGVRNSVTGDAVTADTIMHIGSISKVLNTVLMMQLVDDGLISLTDPIMRHLPELRLKDESALPKITCAMLVNHTSGIDGMILPDYGPDRERIEDAIDRCSGLDQLHPPGGGPSYCNVGMVIAGYLTQKLRGESWYTLVKRRIYEPLGMNHAIADLTDLPRFRHSIGDLTDPAIGSVTQTARAFLPLSFAPCGTTLMMTATDLVIFARSLIIGGSKQNRILSNDACAQMAAPTVAIENPANCHWGLGWMILPGGLLHHTGGGPGVASSLYVHAASGRVAALLTNCDQGHALRRLIVEPIVASWTGHADPTPKQYAGTHNAEAYVGVYENHMLRIEILLIDAELKFQLKAKARIYDNSPLVGQSSAPDHSLRPVGDDVFDGTMLPGIPRTSVRFSKPDIGGRMQELQFMLHLFRRTA